MEFQTNGINIITGKNNVGKTSVLESIDLLFNPEEITTYGNNMDKFINIHQDKATIRCEYTYESGRDQDSIQENTGDTIRNISFEKPDREIVFELINEFLLNRIQNSPTLESGRQTTLKMFRTDDEEYDVEKIRTEFISELNKLVENAVGEGLSDDLLSTFTSNSLLVNVEDGYFPYLYLGNEYGRLTQEISQICAANFVSEIDINDEVILDEIEHELYQLLRRVIRRPSSPGVYLGEPSSIDGVRFIKSLDITDKEIEKEDDYAVILTQIEDSIKDAGLMKNLRDFDIDMLVFEEDGNRYQIPYDFIGDGFKAIVGLLWELKRQGTKSDILLLEEPENHMHPGYIKTLVRFLIQISKESDIQLFITTHDIDFISEFFDVGTEYEEYLQKEFQLIQIQQELAQVLSYDLAKEDLHELHMDLRGL